MSKNKKERGLLVPSFFLLICIISLLVLPASASTIRIDDPLAEVYYDVISPNGTIYMENLNSSEICSLTEEGHYTIMLHPEPLRAASDPGSLYGNMINYGYVILFVCLLVYLAGGISGMFFTGLIKRRS